MHGPSSWAKTMPGKLPRAQACRCGLLARKELLLLTLLVPENDYQTRTSGPSSPVTSHFFQEADWAGTRSV